MRRISDLKSRRWRDGDGLHKRMMELLGGTESRGLDSKGNSSLAPLAAPLEGYWGSILTDWKADRNAVLLGAERSALNFSQDWYDDRAKFLEQKTGLNHINLNPNNPDLMTGTGEAAEPVLADVVIGGSGAIVRSAMTQTYRCLKTRRWRHGAENSNPINEATWSAAA